MRHADLLKDGVPSEIRVEPVVMLTIKRPQAPGRYFHDDGTVKAFHDWAMSVGVFPIKGTGSSGPGFHTGIYTHEDADKIIEWEVAYMLGRFTRGAEGCLKRRP